MAQGSITKSQAESSIKSLIFELSNLTPSAVVTLFDIDLTNLLDSKSLPNLTASAEKVGFTPHVDQILRFHNNIKVFNSQITWQGNTYFPAPIQASGFENSSKGTLPTPMLTISSQSEKGNDILSLLKHQILSFGDIIGAKVTRRRTFAKYLDWTNFQFETELTQKQPFSPRIQELPDGYEPDPNAELPLDIYFIERKTGENKSTIQYQLSSVLDLEGVKVPRRTIISDRCQWEYRGPGCWYQHVDENEVRTRPLEGVNEPLENVPALRKAQLTTAQLTLPSFAAPVATDNDELIASITGKVGQYSSGGDQGKWVSDKKYKKNEFVFILKNNIKFYFVAKGGSKAQLDSSAEGYDEEDPIPVATPPPNSTYWIADECSKSLHGCRLRWASGTGAVRDNGGCPIGLANGLPYGGFPAARKVGGGR